jgi:hypothetical protein
VVVTPGCAATVIAADAVSAVLAFEVAVIVAVWVELVPAGAVYVTEVVDWAESVPAPLNVQVTPSAFWSLVTVAVKVTASVPSTVVAEAVTATLIGFELPPHPFTQINARTARTPSPNLFATITASGIQCNYPDLY